jgi:hypothetical protein
MGKCECRPGYALYVDEAANTTMCQPPTVVLARFLNNRTEKSFKTTTRSNNVRNNSDESIVDTDKSDESEEYS